MSGGIQLNQQHRDLVSDYGFFKDIEIPLTSFVQGTTAAHRIGEFVTGSTDTLTFASLVQAASVMSIKFAAGTTYTTAVAFCQFAIPRDATREVFNSSVASTGPRLKLLILAKGEGATDNRNIEVLIAGLNSPINDMTPSTFSESTKSFTPDSDGLWKWYEVDFGQLPLDGDGFPVRPGAILNFRFRVSAAHTTDDYYIAAVIARYSANASITDPDERT